MLGNLTLFNAMHEKMGWLNTRNRVLAQNITNADTPDYQPKDVTKPEFSKFLYSRAGETAKGGGVKRTPLQLASTTEGHIAHRGTKGYAGSGREVRNTYEITPSGNAVVLEEQMIEANKTAAEYQMVTNLYGRYMDMIKMATARG